MPRSTKTYGTDTKKIIDTLNSVGIFVKDITLMEHRDSLRIVKIEAFLSDKLFRVEREEK